MICKLVGGASPVVVVLFASGCNALATSPAWVGGGMADSAPARMAAEDAKEEQERRILASQPTQIGARHILVMHDDSQAKPPNVERSREAAKARAVAALAKIRAGASFDDIVKEYTDEPGGAERAGDLGVFDRGTMVKPFADAAFALGVGQVSEIVETKYGFHIIKRTE